MLILALISKFKEAKENLIRNILSWTEVTDKEKFWPRWKVRRPPKWLGSFLGDDECQCQISGQIIGVRIFHYGPNYWSERYQTDLNWQRLYKGLGQMRVYYDLLLFSFWWACIETHTVLHHAYVSVKSRNCHHGHCHSLVCSRGIFHSNRGLSSDMSDALQGD